MTLKDFLDVEIRPMMKQLGYRKTGCLFHRQNESFAYAVEFFTPFSATNDEFCVSASIFSFDIANVMGYESYSTKPKDLHCSHYTLFHKDIVNLNGDNSISINDYDIHKLADFIRNALSNLDDFFKSISDIDVLLQCILENGSGRERFFINSIIKYSLLTQRWEYADKLIRREKERRKDWIISPLWVEKYKELCQGDTGHRGFSVSWDSSLLGRRAASQGVKILSKEWDEHMSKYASTDLLYQENQSWIFDNIPNNIEGTLDYKDDSWDFMSAYYYRSGMVAAVSMKVKEILEDMNISKEEYTLIPIRIKDSNTQHYLMFIKSIGHDEIDFSNSLYRKILGDDEYRKFASYSEFSASHESYTIAFPVLPQKYAKRDLIYIQNGAETYMSARLIKAFRETGIKGIEFREIGSLRFI